MSGPSSCAVIAPSMPSRLPTGQVDETSTSRRRRLLQLDSRTGGTNVREAAAPQRRRVSSMPCACFTSWSRRGRCTIEEAPTLPWKAILGEILTIFNGALIALFRRSAPRIRDFRQEVQLFLRDLPQPFSYVFSDVPPSGRTARSMAGGSSPTWPAWRKATRRSCWPTP